MKYIYIKSYSDLTQIQKEKFFIFLKNFTECMVTRKRVVIGQNSLLLDFPENTDIQKIKKLLEKYFRSQKKIIVHIVKRIRDEEDHQVLELEDKQIKI